MIRFRESVRVVQFTKKSRSFVRSVVFPVAVNHSVSCSDSLPPSAPRSHSRITNASRVVQTHFLPPPLVLIRESRMPAESFRLTPSLVLVHESQMPAESVRLTSSLVHNIQTNHKITIHNRAMVQMVINQHNIN